MLSTLVLMMISFLSLWTHFIETKGEWLFFLVVSDIHRDDLSKDVSWLEDSDDKADGVSMLDREWKTRHEQFYNVWLRHEQFLDLAGFP